MIKQTEFNLSKPKKQTVFDKVKHIMTMYPGTRDSYPLLDFYFYPTGITLVEAMERIQNKELASLESVHRARRLVEEDCPDLRGNTYHDRHTKAEGVRTSINKTPIQTIETL